jgi:hypothetical protein
MFAKHYINHLKIFLKKKRKKRNKREKKRNKTKTKTLNDTYLKIFQNKLFLVSKSKQIDRFRCLLLCNSYTDVFCPKFYSLGGENVLTRSTISNLD